MEEENENLFQKGINLAKENPVTSSLLGLAAINPAFRGVKKGINLARQVNPNFLKYKGVVGAPIEQMKRNKGFGGLFGPKNLFGLGKKASRAMLGRASVPGLVALESFDIGRELDKSFGISDAITDLVSSRMGFDERQRQMEQPLVTPEMLDELEQDRRTNENVDFGLEPEENRVDIGKKLNEFMMAQGGSDMQVDQTAATAPEATTQAASPSSGGLRIPGATTQDSDIVSVVQGRDPQFLGMTLDSENMLRQFAQSQGQPFADAPLIATTAGGDTMNITAEQADALEAQARMQAEAEGRPFVDNAFLERTGGEMDARQIAADRRFEQYMQNPVLLPNPVMERLQQEGPQIQGATTSGFPGVGQSFRDRDLDASGRLKSASQSLSQQETPSGQRFTDIRREVKAANKGKGLSNSEINSIARNRFNEKVAQETKEAEETGLDTREQEARIKTLQQGLDKEGPLDIIREGIRLSQIPEEDRTEEDNRNLQAYQAFIDMETAGTLGADINLTGETGYTGDEMMLSPDNPITTGVVSLFTRAAKQENPDLTGQALGDKARELAIAAGYKIPEEK